MSKIDPKTGPFSLPVSDNTPDVDLTSAPAAPGPTDQSSFESKTISPGGAATAPLDQAFTGPGSNVTSPTNEDLIPEPPEEFFDARQTLDTELFTFGDARMSRADITRTIKLVQDMETVLIHALERQLQKQNIPGGAPKETRGGRVRKTVPGPDGNPRPLTFRSPRDQIDSIKERHFSPIEREALVRLAQALPRVTNTNDLTTQMGAFQSEILKTLSNPPIEIYQIRTLLPIQETGSLAPSQPNGEEKSRGTFTRVTSTMLMEKARAAGVFEK